MEIEIQMKPACSVAKVTLAAGESLTTEGGAIDLVFLEKVGR